jgi:hypothetical protein
LNRLDAGGVQPNVRTFWTIGVTLLFVSTPTTFESDYVIDPFDRMGWIGMSDAIVRVRFEAHRSIPSADEPLTQHRAIVLGTFKWNARLGPPPPRVNIIERRGFMQTEDGNWPCWDNDQPLPQGTEALAFLGWDADRQAFLLGTVAHVQLGQRSLRIVSSRGSCDPKEM